VNTDFCVVDLDLVDDSPEVGMPEGRVAGEHVLAHDLDQGRDLIRHRLENEALDRRHGREKEGIERCAAALDMIEARERRSLIRDLVRKTRVEDQLRLSEHTRGSRDLTGHHGHQ
jgi:hypothetical protein